MIEQEKANKKEARRLINLPLNKRPENVYFRQSSRFDFASYMVHLKNDDNDIGVYFQYDGKRLYYLGEYPVENWFLKS